VLTRHRRLVHVGPAGDEMRRECLAAPVSRRDLEFDAPVRAEVVRVAVEYRCVQKDIIATIVRRHESITACLVKLKYAARSQL
jgi:hypothetical protein